MSKGICRWFIFLPGIIFYTAVAQADWINLGGSLNRDPGNSNAACGDPSPCLRISPNGTPFIAWNELSNSVYQVYVSHWDGYSWVNNGGALNHDPAKATGFDQMAINSNGTPYILRHEINSVPAWILYVSHWNGSSWVDDGGALNFNTSIGASGEIAIAPDNTLYVAQLENNQLFLRHWNGSAWINDGMPISFNSYGISFAIAPNGTPYIADFDPGFQIYVYHWNNSTWVNDGGSLNRNSSKYAGFPSLAISPNSIPYVAWHEGNASGPIQFVYVSHLNGSVWETDGGGLNHNPAYQASCPSLAFSSAGIPYVAWMENNGNTITTYVSHRVNGTWFDDGGGFNRNSTLSTWNPSLAIVQNDIPYVAWQESTGAYGNIYVSHWAPPVLSKVYPCYSLGNGIIQLNVKGKYFAGITGVQLKNSGVAVEGTGLNVSGDNNLSAQFQLPALPGLFDLILIKAANSFIFKTVFTLLSPLPVPVQWQVADLGRAGNPASPGRSSIAIGDGDHDGQAEVYVADNERMLAKFKYQNSAGWNISYLPEATGNYFNSLVIADGNSDGDWEIYGACTQPAVYQYQSAGAGWNSNSFCASAGPLATGDAQGDGTPKIYVAGNSAAGQGIMQYSGSPAWQGNTVDGNAGLVLCLLCGDADNDQADELYAANSEQRIFQYKYNGGVWNKNLLAILGNGASNGMALGDLEHAGKNKLYVANQDKNVYQLTCSGASWISKSINVLPGAGQAITIGDGDTDGNDEIYIACDNGHVYQLRLNAGNWQQQDLGNAGVPLNALAVGDGDNDYRLEIYAVGNNGHVYQFKAASAAPLIPSTAAPTPVPDADKALKILHSQINPARGEQARVRWYQTDNASVTLAVYNLLGDKVATLAENRAFAPGQLQEATWNGKTSRGALAGSGIYIVYLRTGSTKAWAKVAVIK